jgi:hypothetical protein
MRTSYTDIRSDQSTVDHLQLPERIEVHESERVPGMHEDKNDG